MNAKTVQFFKCPFCNGSHPFNTDECPVESKPIPAHYKLIGNTLEGKYEIVKIIGEGGMGVVYEAKHLLVGRRYAIKILFPEMATNREIVERFYNEARTAASIGHDHIIEVTDMGMIGASPFLVMEYLEGQSLTKFIEGKILPVEQAAGIMIQVLDALNAVHAKGVIHRDLKPDNIFLIRKGNRNDYVKILDFGISKLKTVGSQNMALTRTGTIMGTPYYMSPEQAAGKKEQDHRVDIYSAGVILYEMLTSNLPFNADNYNALIAAVLTEEPPKPTSFNPQIPVELENIIMKAISKNPHQRYSNAMEFLSALLPFAPSWVSRPSKIPAFSSTALLSTGIGGSAEKAPDTGDKEIPFMETQLAQSEVGTRDLSSGKDTLFEESQKRRKRIWVSLGIVAIVIVVAIGAFFMYIFPKFSGKNKENLSVDNKAGKIELLNNLQNLNEKGKSSERISSAENQSSDSKISASKKVKLEIMEVPEGGVVFLDGKKLEENPSFIESSDNPREIKVQSPGYEDWVLSKVLNSDTVIHVSMVKKFTEEKEIVRGKKKKEEKAGKGESGETVQGEGTQGGYKGKVKKVDIEYPE